MCLATNLLESTSDLYEVFQNPDRIDDADSDLMLVNPNLDYCSISENQLTNLLSNRIRTKSCQYYTVMSETSLKT